MMKRIFSTIVLFVSIFYIPWWAVLLLSAVMAFYFKEYYELLFIGVLVDLLYGTNGGWVTGYGMIGFVGSFVLLLTIGRVKKELR